NRGLILLRRLAGQNRDLILLRRLTDRNRGLILLHRLAGRNQGLIPARRLAIPKHVSKVLSNWRASEGTSCGNKVTACPGGR
ncbi:MAG: hypothetical protein HFG19_02085, partial [Oscillospiraceae bacterium]|nr:hypothetical protein [Oscillospiraceae bacterium]